MRRKRPAVIPALAAVAVLVAACGGSGSSAAPAPSASPAAESAEAQATRIEVSLTDALKIEPATITVPAGEPVTFVVTNAGTTEHEFVVGDEEVQAEHEEEMEGGHMEDDDNALAVPPGETLELTMTFDEPGTTLAGCHVTGHYDGGMKAEIVIE
jgi:uncharacterized cupredoxin-like copper-binding protein